MLAGPDSERACCSPDSVIAARETCHRLGVPHVTLDLREEFRRAVVAPFVRGYARGETPNPCTRCNGGFRFAELLAFARRAGAERLATGHYARIVEHDGRLLLARGAAATKDQSYMLASLDPRRLERICFPLGEQDKEATRTEAERAGLAAAHRPESQEACFLAGDDYREFLGRHGLGPRPGAIVGEDGSELGRHGGFWRFTPGQRRGLGLAASEPLYVLGTRPSANAVVVGPRASLARVGLESRALTPAGALAHGDKRRLELAMLLAADPHVIMLDEPMAGVSAENVPELVELIRSVHEQEGKTVLMVEHHMEVVTGLAQRIAVMHHGALLACDTPAAVMANETVQSAYLGEEL